MSYENKVQQLSKAELEKLLSKMKKANSPSRLQELLLSVANMIGENLYLYFSQALEDLIIIPDKHYFRIVKNRVIALLSYYLAIESKKREAFMKEIITKEIEIEKTGAGSGINV